MILKKPLCPTCNKPAKGTVETLQGIALFIEGASPNLETDYSGTTEVDWDSQSTNEDEDGNIQVACEDGHFWCTPST